MRKVVITGLGINCAVGRDYGRFQAALREGRHGLSSVEWIPISRQNAIASQIKQTPLNVPGRLRRIARDAIAEAIRDAGVTSDIAQRTGLYLATVAGDGLTAERLCEQIFSARSAARAVRAALATFPPGTLADRLARDFGLGGPRDVNTNACASGNIALGRALHAIRAGHIDVAVVCGADQMKPITYYGADRSNILGPTIRPFHRDRNGTALGDGAGALIVESLDHARRRQATIRAVVDGFGISCSEDPHEIIPQLDGRGVARCIRASLKDAGVIPDQIDYINAHATGTINIEISECAGIRQAFGEATAGIPVNATKSFTGHLSSASAVVEIITVVDALQTGFLHETLGLDDPDPALPLNFVAKGGLHRKVSRAVSIAMGAGGVNSAVVLSAPETLEDEASQPGQPADLRELPEVRLTHSVVISETPPVLAINGDTLPAASSIGRIDWIPLAQLQELSGGPANEHYNRAALLSLAAVTRLIAVSKLSEADLVSERLALIVGTSIGGTSTWSSILARAYAANPRHITPSMALSHGAHLSATLISRQFGLIGSTVTLTGGVTSGISALRYALDLIQLDEIDRAIICSTDIADPPTQLAIDLLAPARRSNAPRHLRDAGVALLVEASTAAPDRNRACSIAIAAVEERFAPVGAGHLAPGLGDDALAAALLRSGSRGPLIRIDGLANFHDLTTHRNDVPHGGAETPSTTQAAGLAPEFGYCGAAEPLAAIAAAADFAARRVTEGRAIDVAVTAAGRGGSAACAVLRGQPAGW